MSDLDQPQSNDVAKASLVILSDQRTSDELVDAIGLTPDRAWDKGEPRSQAGARVPHRFSGVEFSSRRSSASAWPEHLDDLLARLAPVKDSIRSLVASLGAMPDPPDAMPACVWISHTTSSATPHYVFSPDQLRILAEFGASLGVSVYSDYRAQDESPVRPR